MGAFGHRNFIADRNVVLKLGVVNVPDANIVSTLLNWRIVLQFLHPFFCVPAAEPFVGRDTSNYMYLVRAAAMYLNRTGAGFNLQIHSPSDL